METVSRKHGDTVVFADRVVGTLRDVLYHSERSVVLTLSGPLGVGKTAFVQCVARALGVSDVVASSSYVLRSDYETNDVVFKHLVHIDLYRFEDVSEVQSVGWDAILRMPNTLVVVEWPERIETHIPSDSFSIVMRFSSDNDRVFSCDFPVSADSFSVHNAV